MDRNRNKKKPLNEAWSLPFGCLDGRGGSKLIYKPGMRKGSIIIREVGPSITKESKINKFPQHTFRKLREIINAMPVVPL